MRNWKVFIPVMALGLVACDGSRRPSSPDVLAQAAGAEFEAQAAAEMLAPQIRLPAGPDVARQLADLWIQYYLLALAAAEDSTLQTLDVSPLVQRQVKQELVSRLREMVIQVDTTFSEEELRREYEAELPGGRIRARHILLQFPDQASEAEVDSVRALASSLRSRLQEGESFEDLARQYSQDEQTSRRGGDLGSFGKNQMAPQFDEAAFALEEGEVSEVVETPFGLHLIRVDERLVPPFEENRDQFGAQLRNRRIVQAESTYVTNLLEGADIELQEGNLETIQELAANPHMSLTSRALRRPLVRYEGGSLTLEDFRTWLMTSAPNVPNQLQTASDPQLEGLLRNLAQSEILVNQALAQGLEVSQERQDSIAEGIIASVKGIAERLGFFGLTPQEGETLEEAADRLVREIMVEIVQEGREVYPLQAVGFALKEQYGAKIFEPGVERTVELLFDLRARTRGAEPLDRQDEPPVATPPDTSGGGD